jgi:hypothetical protein
MSESWLASLKPRQRKKAEQMISHMTDWGAPDAEEWVESEIEEDIPQMARFLMLRGLWSEINAWRDQTSEWMSRMTALAEGDPNGYFADAGLALKQMQEAGVNSEDLGQIARFVAYESIFSVLNRIDEGGDPEAEDAPGWALAEVDANGEGTGRVVASLHEDLLLLDPSGREGRVV